MIVEKEIRKLKQLTEKLKSQGDITEDEANYIFSFLVDGIVNPVIERHKASGLDSCRFFTQEEVSLMNAMCLWYKQVLKKLPEYGNYATTVPAVPEQVKRIVLDSLRSLIYDCFSKVPILDRAAESIISKKVPDIDPQKFSNHNSKYVETDLSYHLFFDRVGGLKKTGLYDVVRDFDLMLEGESARYGHLYIFDEKEQPYESWFINIDGMYGILASNIIKKLDIPTIHVKFSTPESLIWYPRDRNDYLLFIPPEYKRVLESVLSHSRKNIVNYVKQYTSLDTKEITEWTKGSRFDRFPVERIVDDFEKDVLPLCGSLLKKKEIAKDDDSWLEMIR